MVGDEFSLRSLAKWGIQPNEENWNADGDGFQETYKEDQPNAGAEKENLEARASSLFMCVRRENPGTLARRSMQGCGDRGKKDFEHRHGVSFGLRMECGKRKGELSLLM